MLENHNLLNEFPEYRDTIHALKMHDMHFARLFDEYHSLDKQVHRIESGAENTADAVLEELKKSRLFKKDALFTLLREASAA